MSMAGLAKHLCAAAALAFVALAPSLASAHPGHDHKPHVATVQDAGKSAKACKSSDFVQAASTAELTTAQSETGDAPITHDCNDRGCCGSSACHAGPSAVAPAVAVAYPASAGSTLRLRDGPALAAAAVENLKRPPKHFA